MRRAAIIYPQSTRCEVLPALISAVRWTASTSPCRNAFAEPLPTRRVSSVTTTTTPSSEDSLVPQIFNNSRANEREGERMSNHTHSYEPARPDGMGTTRRHDSCTAVSSLSPRPSAAAPLISTVFGSKKCVCGGRAGGRETGERGGGEGRGGVWGGGQDSPLRSPLWREREREERGAGGCSVTAWEM